MLIRLSGFNKHYYQYPSSYGTWESMQQGTSLAEMYVYCLVRHLNASGQITLDGWIRKMDRSLADEEETA